MSHAHDGYFENILKSSRTFLERWKGATAFMWELTVSHKRLTIVLTSAGHEPGNMLLACLDPCRLSGPVRWENANLVVRRMTLPDGEEGFVVSDHGAGVEIQCGALEIKENVKL